MLQQPSNNYLEQFLRLCSCPITLRIIRDPVTLPCGHSFEQSALADWLGVSRDCPLCKLPVPSDRSTCSLNYNLRRACSFYQDQVLKRGRLRPTKIFQIFVKAQKIITILVGDSDSTESIIIKVALKRNFQQLALNFPMKLYYAGKQLKPGFSLRDYGIQPHCTLLCDH